MERFEALSSLHTANRNMTPVSTSPVIPERPEVDYVYEVDRAVAWENFVQYNEDHNVPYDENTWADAFEMYVKDLESMHLEKLAKATRKLSKVNVSAIESVENSEKSSTLVGQERSLVTSSVQSPSLVDFKPQDNSTPNLSVVEKITVEAQIHCSLGDNSTMYDTVDNTDSSHMDGNDRELFFEARSTLSLTPQPQSSDSSTSPSTTDPVTQTPDFGQLRSSTPENSQDLLYWQAGSKPFQLPPDLTNNPQQTLEGSDSSIPFVLTPPTFHSSTPTNSLLSDGYIEDNYFEVSFYPEPDLSIDINEYFYGLFEQDNATPSKTRPTTPSDLSWGLSQHQDDVTNPDLDLPKETNENDNISQSEPAVLDVEVLEHPAGAAISPQNVIVESKRPNYCFSPKLLRPRETLKKPPRYQ